MDNKELIVQQTQKWIKEVVIGLNFCPFAAKEMRLNTIRYTVLEEEGFQIILEQLIQECVFLDKNEQIETSLLILSNGFKNFQEYLDLLSFAENLIEDQRYGGIYQLASFHPNYLFADAKESDPSNFTNRSVYPMLHLLREKSVAKAIENHPNVDGIPLRNIELTNKKGLTFMKQLLEQCKHI